MPASAGMAHDAGAALMIDNTFATPCLRRALASVINVLDPGVIVLGGGMAVVRGGYYPLRSYKYC